MRRAEPVPYREWQVATQAGSGGQAEAESFAEYNGPTSRSSVEKMRRNKTFRWVVGCRMGPPHFPSFFPHALQNFVPAAKTDLHFLQARVRAAPQLGQNFNPDEGSARWHWGHRWPRPSISPALLATPEAISLSACERTAPPTRPRIPSRMPIEGAAVGWFLILIGGPGGP